MTRRPMRPPRFPDRESRSEFSTRSEKFAQIFSLASETHAGLQIDPGIALTYSAVWACVSLISEAVANLPLHIYKRAADDSRERAPDHPMEWLINEEPNPEMDAATFRETLTAHALTWGNAYAEIEYRRGRPVALWPMLPYRVRPFRQEDGSLWYRVTNDRGQPTEPLPASRVLHLMDHSEDGVCGISRIRYARNSISLGLVTEKYGSRFFGEGGRPSGVLQVNRRLDETEIKNLRDTWGEDHGGPNKSHKLGILEEGVTWTAIGIAPNDSQFLETRQFQGLEVCRWFKVPPHMVGFLERATHNNIESQGKDFLQNCLGTWLRRWERLLKRKTLNEAEKRQYYFEHKTEALLSTDLLTRYTAYGIGRQWGWLSADDVCRSENRNSIGEGGKEYLKPVNMVAAGEPNPNAIKAAQELMIASKKRQSDNEETP
jgi:HK97 family phage portal protein